MKTVMLAALLVGLLAMVVADDEDLVPKSCTDEDGTYPSGYVGPVAGKCEQRTCTDGRLTKTNCPIVRDANGNILPETEGLYPGCCPKANK